MTSTPFLKDPRKTRRSPTTLGSWELQDAVRLHAGQAAPNGVRRRFDRVIGLWLGGIVLGTGGCILGASLPYRHPVGVTLSVLWWGFYFGCFGMWLGAVLGMWAERIRVSKSKRWDGKADQIEHPSPTRATINPQGVVRTGPNEQSITKQYVGSTSTHSLHEESS